MALTGTLENRSEAVVRSRALSGGLWVVQIGLVWMFVMAGWGKLVSSPDMVAFFDVLGLGQWFRYYTGIHELAGALLLLTPLAALGAVLLVLAMVGAIGTHLFVVGGSIVLPLLLLLASLAVVAGRWQRTAAVLQRLSVSARDRPAVR